MSTFGDECQRKWALRTVAKLQAEPTKAALLGTSVDEGQLQPYLTQGRPFDTSKSDGSAEIAETALEHLPKPKTPGMSVQKKFILPGPSSDVTKVPYGYLGYKDLYLPSSAVLPFPPPEDAPKFHDSVIIPAVVDFKTTGDFKWAKSASTLRKDPQAVIYAMNAIYETGAPAVDLAWIYMRTKGARVARRVHLRVLAGDVAREFKKIDDVGVKIVETRKQSFAPEWEGKGFDFAMSLPPNPDACENYGGCPYRSHCGPMINVDFKKALEAPVEASMGDSMDLFASLAKRAPDAPPPATTSPVMGVSDSAVPGDAPAAQPAPLGINPPEKNLPPAPPVGAVQVSVASTTTGQAAEADKPKAKRGRKPKEEATTSTTTYPEEPGLIGDVEALPQAVLGESFTIVWGEERYTLRTAEGSEGCCVVGPFEASCTVSPGETLSEAVRRVSAVLYAFAVEERATKLDSFKRSLK